MNANSKHYSAMRRRELLTHTTWRTMLPEGEQSNEARHQGVRSGQVRRDEALNRQNWSLAKRRIEAVVSSEGAGGRDEGHKRGGPGKDGHTAAWFEEERNVFHVLRVGGWQVSYLRGVCVVSAARPAPRGRPRRGIVSHSLCERISIRFIFRNQFTETGSWVDEEEKDTSLLIMEKLERALERKSCP